MTATNYDAMGRFIYGAHRHGGNGTDVEHWMADELRMARSVPAGDIYAAFFSRYVDPDELKIKFDEFIRSLNSRTSPP